MLLIALSTYVSFAEAQGPTKLPVCSALSFDSCHETDGVTPPKLYYSVDPDYPRAARHEELEGTTVMWVIIDAKGKPQDVTIKHSIADALQPQHHDAAVQMDQNAVKAVKKFRFFPTKVNGRPVISRITIEMRFHLGTKPGRVW